MTEQPAASALADFLNEYRRDHCVGVSCANMMDAAAEMLRTQSTEGGIMRDALEEIAECEMGFEGQVARKALSSVPRERTTENQ